LCKGERSRERERERRKENDKDKSDVHILENARDARKAINSQNYTFWKSILKTLNASLALDVSFASLKEWAKGFFRLVHTSERRASEWGEGMNALRGAGDYYNTTIHYYNFVLYITVLFKKTGLLREIKCLFLASCNNNNYILILWNNIRYKVYKV